MNTPHAGVGPDTPRPPDPGTPFPGRGPTPDSSSRRDHTDLGSAAGGRPTATSTSVWPNIAVDSLGDDPAQGLAGSPLGSTRRPPPTASASAEPRADQGAGFDDLDALVDEILGSKPRPIDWTRLSPEASAEQWAVLDAWVRWLVRRYAIDPREIPPCWARHGDLLEELSALHTAHRAAFDPAGPPTGPSDWHANLANTRARLQHSVSRTGCRGGQHRDSPIPDWTDTVSSQGEVPSGAGDGADDRARS